MELVSAEFLSQEQYIITKEERKIFLKLSDSNEEKYKEDFWKQVMALTLIVKRTSLKKNKTTYRKRRMSNS
jgi:hypothetical protein